MNQQTNVSLRRVTDRYRYVLIFLLLASTFVLLLGPVMELPLQVSKDFNEGWNAYQAERALRGDELYPPIDDLTGNNYPPLSYYVFGGLGVLVGDNVVAGRGLALVCLFAAAICIGFIVRCLEGSRVAAFVAALFFVAYFAARFGLYVAMNDPQLLASAVMLAGFACFLRSKQQGPLFVASIAIMVTAGFFKHSLIPIPLAITVWLLLYNRAAFVRWAVFAAGFLFLWLVVLYFGYGANLFRGMFLHVKDFSLVRMANRIDEYFTPLLPLMGLSAVAAALRPWSPSVVLVGLYVAISVPWGGYMAGTAIDVNAVLDLVIALVIGAGLLLHAINSSSELSDTRRRQLETAVLLTLVLSVAVAVPDRYVDMRKNMRARSARVQEAARDIDLVRSQYGPVMCESLAVCYWAGKPAEVDFTLSGAKMKRGLLDQNKLIQLLERRHFDLIQTQLPTGTSFRLPREVNAKILDNYTIARVSEVHGAFLVPKQAR